MLLDWIGAQEHTSRLIIWGDLQRRLQHGGRLPGYTDPDVRHALGRT